MASFNNGSITANVTLPVGYPAGTAGAWLHYYLYSIDANGQATQVTPPVTASWTNPIIKSVQTDGTEIAAGITFGNPGGPNDNTDGSQGLAPGVYKVEVELRDSNIVNQGNLLCDNVEDSDGIPGFDPDGLCNDAQGNALNLALSSTQSAGSGQSNGSITVEWLSTVVSTWTLNGQSVTPTNTNNTTYTFGTLAAGTYTIYVEDANGCFDSNTFVVSELADPCLNFVNSASATATNINSSNNTDGTIGVTFAAGFDVNKVEIDSGSGYTDITSTVTINVQAGTISTISVSNAGTYTVRLTTATDGCESTASVTVGDDGGDPVFTCNDAGFTMPATTTDQINQPSIGVASVSQGTLQAVSPSVIQSGVTTYTATIVIPAGFQDAGSTMQAAGLTPCTATSDGTTSGPDPCLNFAISNVSTVNASFGNQDGQITFDVSSGTVSSVTNGEGGTSLGTISQNGIQVTVSDVAPGGPYDMWVETQDGCSAVASVTVLQDPDTSSNNRLWYYFHGIDRNWLVYGGDSLLFAPLYRKDNNGVQGNTTTSLEEAMQHYFDNRSSLGAGYELQEYDMPTNLDITGNNGQTILNYPAIVGDLSDSDFCYIMIPQTSDFEEDLTDTPYISYPAGSPAGVAAARVLGLTIDGEAYVLYQVQGGTVLGAVDLTFV